MRSSTYICSECQKEKPYEEPRYEVVKRAGGWTEWSQVLCESCWFVLLTKRLSRARR